MLVPHHLRTRRRPPAARLLFHAGGVAIGNHAFTENGSREEPEAACTDAIGGEPGGEEARASGGPDCAPQAGAEVEVRQAREETKGGAEAPPVHRCCRASAEGRVTDAAANLRQLSQRQFNKFFRSFNNLLDNLVHGRPLIR